MSIILNGTTGITSTGITETADGNVGIGTSSPAYNLDVYTTAAAFATKIKNFNGTEAGGGLWIDTRWNTSGNRPLKITSNNEGISLLEVTGNGSLLVGKTSANSDIAGFEANATGFTAATRDNGTVFVMDRLTSDGAILVFRKDSTGVGSIGTASSDLTMGTSDTGIRFADGDSSWRPHNPATGGDRDNAIDIGSSSQRFDDIYATNGTIQTSDRNEKQDIEALSEAEARVAVACKGLLRKFRWKDAVAEKGDEARIHFGIIAQDLQDAFAAEGLDAGRYAMFISSTWTDEETGEERTRLGVRYPELLAFIIGAI